MVRLLAVNGTGLTESQHLSSFFINDGADFPDLIHAVKFEADKGFPTGGTAHTTAYDFFTQHPEGLSSVLAMSPPSTHTFI